MIIREQEIKNKLKAKGVLIAINNEELHIEDEKTGDIDILSFNDLKFFEGKAIVINIADSTKSEIEGYDDEDDDEDNDGKE